MSTIPKAARATALLAVLGLGMSACGDPVGPAGGSVQFTLSALDPAPGAAVIGPAPTGDRDGDWQPDHPALQSATVTFSSILARNFDGVLVNVDMELPVTVDVVAMENRRRSVTLPDGDLPPGTYDQIVIVLTAVQGVTANGTTITVEPPGGGWTAVVNVCPFEVSDAEPRVVGLQLPVRSAFTWDGGRFRFEPRFRARTRCDMPPPPPPEGPVNPVG